VSAEGAIWIGRGVRIPPTEVAHLNDAGAVHEVVSVQVIDPSILVIVYSVQIGPIHSTISIQVFPRVDPQLTA
jgi:hypothetical protein